MLSKESVIVLRHYLDQGLSKTAIARKLGVTRRTVQRYAKSGKTEARYGPRPARPAKLAPYLEYLVGRLGDYPELSAVRLLAELRERGYGGGYTAVKDFVRARRPRPVRPFERRFEVEPGEQAQVDFATFKVPFGTVYALLVVLSWSRALWARFSFHQDQLTVLGGLHQAFVAFGGVPRTVLFDRMKTAVVAADGQGGAIFNPELVRFAAHYGFGPRACRPYRAQTKGRVERSVGYLRGGFFYGREFRDLADLNEQCATWLSETANARVHGTTGEIPGEQLGRERAALRPLPREPYLPLITVGRHLSRDGFLSYNGNQYSVPDGLDRHEVGVRATLSELHVLDGDRLVATHPLLTGRGERRLDPSHRRAAPEAAADLTALVVGRSELDLEAFQVERRSLTVYEGVLR